MIYFRRQLLVDLGLDDETICHVADLDGVAVCSAFFLDDAGEIYARFLESEPAPRTAMLVGLRDRLGWAAQRAARVDELCTVEGQDAHRLPSQEEARHILSRIKTERVSADRAADALCAALARFAIHEHCESPLQCWRSGSCRRWLRDLTGCAAAAAARIPETAPGATRRAFVPCAQSFPVYGGHLHVESKDQPRLGRAWYVPREPGFSSYDGDVLSALDNLARQLRSAASDVEAVRAQLSARKEKP